MMNKSEELFQNHLFDLADQAWQRNMITYSDFLNLNEQNIFHSIKGQFSYMRVLSFGGYDNAERQMIAFIPDAFSDLSDSLIEFPIQCIEIRPTNARFAEKLSHRDYLGSFMNQGIDRSVLGDILVSDQNAYVFCKRDMAEFLMSELTRIRHTTVMCRIVDCLDISYKPSLKEISGSVASVRLDTLMALAFQESRSRLSSCITEGYTFVNGRLITSNGYHVREGDVISVRGYGRFQYVRQISETKKGRLFVQILKYI